MSMSYNFSYSNKPKTIYKRKKLRNNPTMSEKVLWQELKMKKLGYKFRRQFNIGKYIVDFYCYDLKLVIELDGPIHEDKKIYDDNRQKCIENKGFVFIRYKNDEVLFDRDAVMQDIINNCDKRKKELCAKTKTPPNPLSLPLVGGEDTSRSECVRGGFK